MEQFLDTTISAEVGARIMELLSDQSVRSAAKKTAYGYRSYGPIDIDDVLGDLAQILWANWDRDYAPKAPADQRRFACGTVKNLVKQHGRRMVNDYEARCQLVVSGPIDDVVLAEYEAQFSEVLAATAAIPGVCKQTLIDHARRSPATREQIKAAVLAVKEGRQPDLAPIAARVLSITQWAAARVAQGLNLSTVAAVKQGAAASVHKAHKELTGWWVSNADGGHCPTRFLVAGLLDHVPAARQHRAAHNTALGLRERGHQVSLSCSTICNHVLEVAR